MQTSFIRPESPDAGSLARVRATNQHRAAVRAEARFEPLMKDLVAGGTASTAADTAMPAPAAPAHDEADEWLEIGTKVEGKELAGVIHRVVNKMTSQRKSPAAPESEPTERAQRGEPEEETQACKTAEDTQPEELEKADGSSEKQQEPDTAVAVPAEAQLAAPLHLRMHWRMGLRLATDAAPAEGESSSAGNSAPPPVTPSSAEALAGSHAIAGADQAETEKTAPRPTVSAVFSLSLTPPQSETEEPGPSPIPGLTADSDGSNDPSSEPEPQAMPREPFVETESAVEKPLAPEPSPHAPFPSSEAEVANAGHAPAAGPEALASERRPAATPTTRAQMALDVKPSLPRTVQRIGLMLQGENRAVQLRISDGGASVRIAVMASDSALAQQLRQALPDLMSGLSQQGYEPRVSPVNTPVRPGSLDAPHPESQSREQSPQHQQRRRRESWWLASELQEG